MSVHIDAVFQTLADPTRRRVIDALRQGELQVGEIVDRVEIHQSGVSRHLRILSEAGFVAMRADGQKHFYSLRAQPFREIEEWLAKYRGVWEARLDRFDAALEKRKKASSKTRDDDAKEKRKDP